MIEHAHAGPLRITHEDEFGIRIVQRCDCGATRVLNMWRPDPLINPQPSWLASDWARDESERDS